MTSITPNLNRWINTLYELRDDWWKSAFMSMIDRYYQTAFDILWEEARRALARTQEYDIPEFSEPLRTAIYDTRTISINLNVASLSVNVDIDLNTTAGRLEDYANAVEIVRSNKSSGDVDIVTASNYWKYFIYQQAREGRRIKKRRKPGQRGRTPTHANDGLQQYRDTISERLQAVGTLAPFWSLIDQGNTGGNSLDRGGIPYPVIYPTNFVSLARQRIQNAAQSIFERERRDLEAEIRFRDFGEGGALGDILDVLGADRRTTRHWTPEQVIRRIEIDSVRYDIWLTRTGKIGLRRTR